MSNYGPLPENQDTIGRGNYGPLGDATNGGTMSAGWRFYAPYDGTGKVYEELPSTDLHLVVDDAGGVNWASRRGGFVAARNGLPSVGLETPLYPAPGSTFNGTGFRNAMQCSAVDFYALPSAPVHDLTTSSTTTYDITFITGDFTNPEIIISNDSSIDYNFYVLTMTYFGLPVIEVRVRHTVTDAVIRFNCNRFSLYRIKFTYSGFNRQLSLDVNAQNISTVTGSGNTLTGGTAGLYIGNGFAGLPCTTNKIIEIQRHQTILSTSNWKLLCNRSWNIQDVHDIQPTIVTRNTKAGVYINNKMWMFGENWPRVDQYGYISEDATNNLLQNSTFTEAFNTGWSILSGFGNITYQPDIDDNAVVGGTGLKFQNDIIGTSNAIVWLTPFVNANTPCYFTCQWKSLTPNAQAYFLIVSNTTSNFYDAVSGVWQPFAVYNTPGPASLSKQKFDLILNSDFLAGNITIFISNSALDFNTEAFSLFHIQFTDGVDSPVEPYVFENAFGGPIKNPDILQYNQFQAIDYTKGEVRVDITPQRNSNQAALTSNKSALGGLTAFLFTPILSTGFTLTDGLNTCSITPTYNNDQTLNLQAQWGTNLVLKEFSSGLSSNTVFTPPLNLGDLSVGGDLFAISQPFSRIKNLRIR